MIDIITSQIQLTLSSTEVTTKEEGKEIIALLENRLLNTNGGVGLAAPQIGILKKAFVVNHEGQFYRFINPSITYESEEGRFDVEGCLSIPNKIFSIKRSDKIIIRDDINKELLLQGYLARVVLHEYDHLKGITLIQSGQEIKLGG